MAEGPPDRIEKIMSLDLAEFRRSLARLPDAAEASSAHEGDPTTERFFLALDAGQVVLSVEVLPPQTLGTLVTLPRSRVLIDLTGLPDAEDRNAFLVRFDRVFQRGGG